jgi:hypothetical protein
LIVILIGPVTTKDWAIPALQGLLSYLEEGAVCTLLEREPPITVLHGKS